MAGNEQEDSYAKAAGKQTASHDDDGDAPEALLRAVSLSHMSRSATEARSRAAIAWITIHERSERRYRPPPGRGLRNQYLRNRKKELPEKYY